MAKDLFSKQSKDYALYRPVYPSGLFEYILSFVTEKKIAWDCATGNGQSALPLSFYFEKLYATDISQKQLDLAPAKDNIGYINCPAERTPFDNDFFDLITVSQAYHWLDWTAFHREACRVGKQNCVVAVWMYHLLRSEYEELNQLIHHFYKDITGPYWDAERKYVDDHYTTVPFDFDPLPSKDFFINTVFTKKQLLGYFSSWSATQNFVKANHYSPVREIESDLDAIWPGTESRSFLFPIVLKLGRIVK